MHRRKRLDEEPFSHLRTLKKEREKERRRVRFIKGLEQGVKMVNPSEHFFRSAGWDRIMADKVDLYHLYRDQTFFQYNVLLARDDEENGIQGERYILAVGVFLCLSISSFICNPTQHLLPILPNTPFQSTPITLDINLLPPTTNTSIALPNTLSPILPSTPFQVNPPSTSTSYPQPPTLRLFYSTPQTNTNPLVDPRIQRQTAPLLVRRKVLQKKRRHASQGPPTKQLAGPLLARLRPVRELLPHQDRHPLGAAPPRPRTWGDGG